MKARIQIFLEKNLLNVSKKKIAIYYYPKKARQPSSEGHRANKQEGYDR